MNTIATTYPASRGLPAGRRHSGSGVWNSLKDSLKRLSRFAPEVPTVRDPVREAAEVRAMADALRHSDPRFASDLYAAADRHERLYAAADGGDL
jgi:hypothetical protein